MHKWKFYIVVGLCLLLFHGETAANKPTNHHSLTKQVEDLSQLIEKEYWKDALEYSIQLKSIYKQELWKLQLLGDEEEYEELSREINKLKTAVQQQDQKQAQVSLANIQSILDEIYSW